MTSVTLIKPLLAELFINESGNNKHWHKLSIIFHLLLWLAI